VQAFLVDHEDGEVEFVGNRTECALLVLARKWGQDYKALREDQHASLQGEYAVGQAGRRWRRADLGQPGLQPGLGPGRPLPCVARGGRQGAP
jgi:hypothetical protein